MPVYDPMITGQGLGFCGLSLCKSMLPEGQENDSVVWKNLCNSSWFHSKYSLEVMPERRVQNRLRDLLLYPSEAEIPYKELPIMSGLNIQQNAKSSLKERINHAITRQKGQITNFQQVLGIAAGGSFASIQIHSLINESGIAFSSDHPYMKMSLEKLKNMQNNKFTRRNGSIDIVLTRNFHKGKIPRLH